MMILMKMELDEDKDKDGESFKAGECVYHHSRQHAN